MKNLRCIIVDDEPLAVKLIKSVVERTPGMEVVADLVFLDIQMPDVDGMELAHAVQPPTRIIFTTAFKEYAFDSYEVEALDFLLKPVRYVKFLEAVEKAKRWFGRAEEEETSNKGGASSAYIRVDGELRQVLFDSILYVCGMKDYVMFYLKEERKPLITHLTMKAVEAMLPASQFLRVHRSYIVAVGSIRKVDRNDCIYIGEEIIHVTQAYAEAFHNYLDQLTP